MYDTETQVSVNYHTAPHNARGTDRAGAIESVGQLSGLGRVPVGFPIAVGTHNTQSQHLVGVVDRPPGPRDLQAFLDDVAVCTLDLPGADR